MLTAQPLQLRLQPRSAATTQQHQQPQQHPQSQHLNMTAQPYNEYYNYNYQDTDAINANYYNNLDVSAY